MNTRVKNEAERFVSNLGKVTLLNFAEQQSEIVATKIDPESSLELTESVECLKIPTDFKLTVSVPEGLLKNDSQYFDFVKELNETVLDEYDLSMLDSVGECQYLDQACENTSGILRTVLTPNVDGHIYTDIDELQQGYCDIEDAADFISGSLPRVGRKTLREEEFKGSRLQTVLAPKVDEEIYTGPDDFLPGDYCDIDDAGAIAAGSLPCTGRKTVQEEAFESSTQARGVEEFEKTTRKAQNVRACDITELNAEKKDSSTGEHEAHAADDYYVDMTSPAASEDGYCVMTRSSPRHKESESEISVQRAEGVDSSEVVEMATLSPADKVLLNIPVPLDESSLKLKQPDGTCNGETKNETIEMKDDLESSETKPTSQDLPAESSKEDALIIKRESAIEEPSRTLPVSSVSKDQGRIPADLASLSVEGVEWLLRTLNMACYVNTFRSEQIDGEILMELDKEELMSLEVSPFHVVKLMKVIAGWRPSVGD